MIATENTKTVILSPDAQGALREVSAYGRADAFYLRVVICPVKTFVSKAASGIIGKHFPEYRTIPNGAELHLWGRLKAADGRGAK